MSELNYNTFSIAEKIELLKRNIPDEMQSRPQWVVWRVEPNPDKPGSFKKLPYQPGSPDDEAKTNKPSTWSTFDDAVQCFTHYVSKDGHCFDGVGFVLTADDPYVFIDLDKLSDDDERLDWLERCGSYAEWSQSGEGIHIILKGHKPAGAGCRRDEAGIEFYEDGRYCAITGNVVNTYNTVGENQKAIDDFGATYWPQVGCRVALPASSPVAKLAFDDDAIIEKAMSASNGSKFKRLWGGDLSDYNDDHSSADFALLQMLAFWTGKDAVQMDTLFRQSGLYRKKWERTDYRERSLNKAIESCTEVYTPPIERPTSSIYVSRELPKFISSEGLDDIDQAMLREGADDNGNAMCVKMLYGEQIAYTKAFGWCVWNGIVWERDADGKVKQLVIAALTHRRALAAKANIEAIVKAAKPSATNIRNTIYILQALVVVDDNTFEPDADLLNFQNGVVHLPTGDLLPHDPKYHFMASVPHDYKPEAAAQITPVVELLRSQSMSDEEITYIQTMCGYFLTGHNTEKCFWYFYGAPNAGKGTFAEMIHAAMGKTFSVMSDYATFAAKRDADSNNFDLAPLRQARFVFVDETPEFGFFDDRKIKAITGGTDIRCCFKGHTHFEYKPQFKCLVASNFKLRANVRDAAFWDRVNVVDFPNGRQKEDADKAVKAMLLSPEISRAYLAWAIEGAKRWYASKKAMQTPARFKAATNDTRSTLDYVKRWLNECCILDPTAYVSTMQARESFANWCEDNGGVKYTGKWNEELRAHGVKPNATKREGSYVTKIIGGMRLRDLNYEESKI